MCFTHELLIKSTFKQNIISNFHVFGSVAIREIKSLKEIITEKDYCLTMRKIKKKRRFEGRLNKYFPFLKLM